MKRNKRISIITAAVFLVFLFGFGIAFWIVPDSDFSDEENRTLETFPDFSMKSFTEGEFGSDMDDYFADQFPLRDLFVGVKGISETVLAKGENNGVLLGRNGQLAVHKFSAYKDIKINVSNTDYFFESNVVTGMDKVNKLSEKLQAADIPFCAVFAPRTIDVAASAFDYPADSSLHDLIYASLDEGVNAPDLLQGFRDKYDNGEYVYYRTDHHWTTAGAYYAYCNIMKSWGLEESIIPASKFTVTDTYGFYGTTWSRAGLKYVPADMLSIWRLGNEDSFTLTDKNNGSSFRTFYNTDYLEAKDKYSVFLGGMHNVQTVIKDSDGTAEREKLLVAKDSFANSVIPFLAQHFDIVITNLSSTGDETNITKYADEYGCSRVLIIYNYENIIGSPRLGKIR